MGKTKPITILSSKLTLSFQFNSFDIVVYKNEIPWMIIECKEAKVRLNEKTMEQILQYQQVLTAQYLIISNGHETMGAKIESGKLQALQNFPEYL
jgi:Holliday junction resolvase